MRHLWLYFLVTASLLFGESDPKNSTAEDQNKFGWELYRIVKKDEGNLCFSPFSIVSALSIPYLGAEGKTQQQMRETLFFAATPTEQAQSIFKLDDFLTRHPTNYPQSYRILTANSLWVQERMRLQSSFLSAVRRDFRSTVQRVNFINATEVSRGKINRWVSHQTNNKIVELIPKGFLTPSTRMVVASALFLKAHWMKPFSKNETHQYPFFLIGKKTITVPMMYQIGSYPYLELDDVTVLELPLERPSNEAPELVVDIVLPKDKKGLQELEDKLSLSTLQSWFEKMQNSDVSVTLPKFIVNQSLALVDAFKEMGMVAPFTDQADFSGITGNKDLMISKIIHQAYFDLAEGGVEAAAATAASMSLTSMPIDTPKVFKADRPFLFFLRDRQTGVILFIGRLMDPSKQIN